jgi:hypothetical protein
LISAVIYLGSVPSRNDIVLSILATQFSEHVLYWRRFHPAGVFLNGKRYGFVAIVVYSR